MIYRENNKNYFNLTVRQNINWSSYLLLGVAQYPPEPKGGYGHPKPYAPPPPAYKPAPPVYKPA